jgi:serine phosphatase RsbU (regulator of sigma subunit)
MRLSPLDVVVFYTDGLLEIGRPDHADQLERLGQVVSSSADKSCDEIADRLLQTLTQRSPRIDDVALIVVNWVG